MLAEAVEPRVVPRSPDWPVPRTAALALLVGYAPLLALHLWSLWRREQYQYFPFVIAAFGYLLVTRYQSGSPARPVRVSWRITACYLFAWLLLAGATLIQSPWLAAVSLNILLGGILLTVARQRQVTNLLGIWLLLWLLIPLPFHLDTGVVLKLQNLSSRISSGILDMWGVRHLMYGNVLQLPDKQFFVDEACSGIVSVMSVVACGMIWGVWRNRSLLHLVLLLLAGICWAISLNVARICIITFAHAWLQMDLSTGWQHDALGLALFSLTFVALISTDQLLEFAMRPIRFEAATTDEAHQNPLIRGWNWLVAVGDPRGRDETSQPSRNASSVDETSTPRVPNSPLLLAGFALLGLVSLGPIAIATRGHVQAVEHALQLEREFLPERLGSLVLKDFESIHRPAQSELGDYSKWFTYEDETTGRSFTISLDFPFSGGWHELCVCYKNTGWTLQQRRVALTETHGEWPVITGEFERGSNEFGFLAFSNFNADAIGMSPPTDLIFWKPWRRLRRRLLRTVSEQVFQVQVWTSDDTPIDDATRAQVEATLLDVREKFRLYFESE